MALARIFSRSPEQTTALSHQLQQHGYRVEVLSPDEAPTTFADLEIQLEACDPADVLRRAAELAARLHCDIAVAPGALQAETAPEPVAAAPSLPEEQVAAVIAADQTAPEVAAPLPVSMETHPVLQAAQETELGSGRSAQAGRWLGATLAAGIAAADKLLASCGAQFRESMELARIGLAKVQTMREQRLLDLTRRRAEAQQHALELKAGRNVVNAYLLRLQQAALEPVPEAQPLSSQHATPLVKPSALSWKELALNWKEKIGRIRLRKWEAVFAAMALAGGLLGIGLTVAFHSRPTLSANRGVIVPPAAVTPQTPGPKPASPPRPSPAVRKVTPKPAVQARRIPPKAAPQRNPDLVARDVTVRHVPAPKPTPRVQADGWKHFSDMSN